MDGRVLIVDDEASVRRDLGALLEFEGLEVQRSADAFHALGKLLTFEPQIVLADLWLPGLDGLSLLRRIRDEALDPAVVLMSGDTRVQSALAALHEGAADYLAKPIDPARLLARVGELLEARPRACALPQPLPRVIGQSAAMRMLASLVHRVAPSRASVLLAGETGTGKERVAEAIHALSPRAAGPLVKVACGGLAESVLESELFGHERGAFTDAVASRAGRFELAHGGTLLLDEIGEVAPGVQVKLLRFLQEHTIERVGSNRARPLDVRVIAATHRDLGADARAGRFRQDLLYRLDVVRVEVPPLRDREGDIALLARHFLELVAGRDGRGGLELSAAALACLERHDWPGNVRELEHAIERAVVMCRGPLVEEADLPDAVRRGPAREHLPRMPGATFAEVERYAIERTLTALGGNKRAAARMLGISARTLQARLHAYGRAADVPDGG